jgi:hypothetical protein
MPGRKGLWTASNDEVEKKLLGEYAAAVLHRANRARELANLAGLCLPNDDFALLAARCEQAQMRVLETKEAYAKHRVALRFNSPETR